jgi:RHS repeat-associated protein
VAVSNLDWTYSTDGVGNVTAIDDANPSNPDRSFGYQPYQYFLTSAQGPATWATHLWSYDREGNVIRNGLAKLYVYQQNAATTGNTPLLAHVDSGLANKVYYTYDEDGRLKHTDGTPATWTQYFVFDEEVRLTRLQMKGGQPVDFRYDGRGFLSLGTRASDGLELRPIYSSSGVYLGARRTPVSGDEELEAVLYFAGRPVAQWKKVGTATATLTYLTTDHLGTPILATDASQSTLWSGGFEPYGRDADNASGIGLTLRLPGQLEDPLWQDANLDTEVYYNVNRWYEPGTGRYASFDPLLRWSSIQVPAFSYVEANPIGLSDWLGLVTARKDCGCCTLAEAGRELLRIQDLARRGMRLYRANKLGDYGFGCGDSADSLTFDIERFVAPKCWLVSSQLLAARGSYGAGDVLNDFVFPYAGFQPVVHAVVRLDPCAGHGSPYDALGLDAYYFDRPTVHPLDVDRALTSVFSRRPGGPACVNRPLNRQSRP